MLGVGTYAKGYIDSTGELLRLATEPLEAVEDQVEATSTWCARSVPTT
ncbi:MAG: hypothetical protein ACRDKG_01010 [Actinomycetota bacterium]